MDCLRRAVANGYTNTRRLRDDPDLESLRAREDFRKLLADLEARRKESGPGQVDR